MQKAHIKYLACPKCYSSLTFKSIDSKKGNIIESGLLSCSNCHKTYPVVLCSCMPVPLAIKIYNSDTTQSFMTKIKIPDPEL